MTKIVKTIVNLYHAWSGPNKPDEKRAAHYTNVKAVHIDENGVLTFSHTCPDGRVETITTKLPYKIINY